MNVKHACTGEPPGEPGSIPFSVSPPREALGGTPRKTPLDSVALEIHFAGKRLGALL
jgi:hypothetical protein